MSATVYAPVVRRQYEGADAWSEEKKEEYANQWTNFAALMAKRIKGQTRAFDATVLEVGPAHQVPNTYKDAKTEFRTVRTLKFQLAQDGVDMLRFQKDSADNPFNDKTLLHQLIIAACGFVPVQEEGLSINFNDLVGKRVRITIEKQNQRTDGKRGGFYTDIKLIEPVFEDDDLPPAPAPKRTVRENPPSAGGSTVARPTDDDEIPF